MYIFALNYVLLNSIHLYLTIQLHVSVVYFSDIPLRSMGRLCDN